MLSLIKALKLAESLEETRAKTYFKYLKIVDFPAGKQALQFLAKAEEGHLRFLKRQSKRLDKGERIFFSKLHQPEIIFPIGEDSLKGSIESMISDIGIFKIVLDFERYDVKFYEYAYAQSESAESKELFKKMGKLEEKHLKLVSKTIELAENSQKALMQKDPRVLLYKMTKRK